MCGLCWDVGMIRVTNIYSEIQLLNYNKINLLKQNMKTTIYCDYSAPTIELIEVAVESGIATTGGGIDNLPVFNGPDF